MADGRFLARIVVEGKRRTVAITSTRDEGHRAVDEAVARLRAGAAFVDIRAGRRFDSYVYFIQDGDSTGAIKIGRAKNPPERLRLMQTSAARRLVLLCALPGGPRLELALHAAFAGARLSGEWFEPTKELVALVEELTKHWGRAGHVHDPEAEIA